MNEKKILVHIALFVVLILILNTLIMKFHWYFSIWWLDMPMHVLGGFWLGLVFIYLFKIKNLSFLNIAKIILGFLLIAILWEVFEISIDKIITKNYFNTLDTLSDICFGLSGAGISIIYFAKRIMIKEKIEI